MRFAELLPLAARAERWLLPGACLLCDAAVPEPADALICDLCRGRLRRLPEPQCLRCGQPIPVASDPCRICAAWPTGFARVRSAVWLDEHARQAVHRLKYGGWWRVSESLAGLMLPLLRREQRLVLVPVPLARRRLARRGYNQAERLARGLGDLLGAPVRPELLWRVRETGTQTALAPEARQANVADAFMGRSAPEARLLLVDDVFTTGSTLAAAAASLLEAGAERVEAVTFARAKPPIG